MEISEQVDGVMLLPPSRHGTGAIAGSINTHHIQGFQGVNSVHQLFCTESLDAIVTNRGNHSKDWAVEKGHALVPGKG